MSTLELLSKISEQTLFFLYPLLADDSIEQTFNILFRVNVDKKTAYSYLKAWQTIWYF